MVDEEETHGAKYFFYKLQGRCVDCWKDIDELYPTVFVKLSEWGHGFKAAEFGQPLCEWIPEYRSDVTEYMACPYCGARMNKSLHVFDDKEKAETYFNSILKTIEKIVIPEDVQQEIDSLISLWRAEEFLDEYHDHEFKDGLLHFVKTRQQVGLSAMLATINRCADDVDFVHDILAYLGAVDSFKLQQQILEVLIAWLQSPIPRLRHGVIKGLEALGNVQAIPALRAAAAAEDFPLLRNMMNSALTRLKVKRAESKKEYGGING